MSFPKGRLTLTLVFLGTILVYAVQYSHCVRDQKGPFWDSLSSNQKQAQTDGGAIKVKSSDAFLKFLQKLKVDRNTSKSSNNRRISLDGDNNSSSKNVKSSSFKRPEFSNAR